jgi:chromosome segregation protein
MYLKGIEVQGFKSFANKINFEFHNGITCIVGPNGSGKSNVGDAVRWVLGEQSAKQLRGSNMQDVIFSGTELRKPQGYAYVAITLDNSDHKLPVDYEEVTVSRRVYRSGESEYKINGVNSRLKDVQELFYDTGIGKEGYSIIGQGQIDKIISNKPDERRELFDEAVGIVKFKRRKKETLKKLESEHSNLVRVTDILYELEKQVGPLQRQSENAKTYLKLRDELKDFDKALFTLDYEDAEHRLAEVEHNTQIVTADLQDTTKANDDLKSQYEEVNNQVHALEEQLNRQNQIYNDSSVAIQQKEGRVLVLKEQINTEKSNADHVKERLEMLSSDEQRYQQEQRSIQEQRDENEEREQNLSGDETDLSNTLAALDIRIANHARAVESNKGRLLSLLNEKSDAAAKLQHYTTLEQQQLIRRGEISARGLKLSSEREELTAQISGQETDLQNLESSISEQKAALAKQEQQRGTLRQTVAETQKKLQASEQNYRVSSSRAESLRNLEERYEGYQNSIRRVMEYAKSSHAGALGVISDLIHLDKKYETAIEIALGGSIQNIVTDSTQTAKALISYLKTNKFGRATFLPLDAYQKKSEFGFPDALRAPGVIGIASELVEYDPKFTNVISYLLGRTLVVDHIDHASELAKRFRYSIRIVTLEGDLLSPGGSLTGGTYKNTGNLLGRKNEIQELEKAVREAKKEIQEYGKTLKSAQDELEKAEAQCTKLSGMLQSLLLTQTAEKLKLDQSKARLDNVNVTLADVTSETKQLESELAKLRQEKDGLAQNLSSIENENSDSEKNISDDEKKLTDEKEKREQLSASLSSVQIELSNLKQKKEFLHSSAERVCDELDRISGERGMLLEREKEIAQAVEGIEHAIGELTKEHDACIVEKQKAQEEITRLNAEKTQIMGEQKEFFAKQQEISGRQKDLEVELLRLQNQKEKLEEHMDERVTYLWTEYEMSPSEAHVPVEEITLPMSELKKNVTALKGKIKALGNVNVNAIEQYKEVAERYEFMKGQYEDLTKAEEQLHGIINELDEGMRKQFNEQFARIQTEFDQVFRELFGGGHGKLELVEGEDVIEAGIRIISQPPGKKLQNMMQLSGGEKALTAIALLFAIQNLKPSPFCLLDEIEAALDDSNVSRFAGYLHKLTEHTQFILISHRRGTMVMADRLYGITMQEKGVSTLVSVNLIEQELDN